MDEASIRFWLFFAQTVPQAGWNAISSLNLLQTLLTRQRNLLIRLKVLWIAGGGVSAEVKSMEMGVQKTSSILIRAKC